MERQGNMLIFIFPVILFFIMSCAGTDTPGLDSGQISSMYMENEYSLLVKVKSTALEARKCETIPIEIDGNMLNFELKPLFPMDKSRNSNHWVVLQYMPKEKAIKKEIHPWSLAHTFLKKIGKEFHEEILTVEADIHHHWYFDDFRRHLLMPASCSVKSPVTYWPYRRELTWHLNDSHSQLRSAREYVANSDYLPVRIAHLDTGYDPTHITCPEDLMRVDLGYNFYEDTTDAQDPGTYSIFNPKGHGTGTLAVLAGAEIDWTPHSGFPGFDDYIGAAGTADIVPVRIYPSVVHFKTRYLAQGIYYAINPRGNPGNICNVVSLSMGGVASHAWADAVNDAYEAGVAIFAASGDRYGKSPPATTVYPARFHRVVSVVGVTANDTPYYKKCNFCRLQGSFGPDWVMKNAIAAYGANIPWAVYNCNDLINLNGEGTSLATCQVAGAAALWLQIHGGSYENNWKKVEAVRIALFETAKKDIPGMTLEKVYTCFGNGVLQAMDALDYEPDPDILVKQPEDAVHFPLLTLLLEYFESFFEKQRIAKSLREKIRAMYELEMVQLHTGNTALQGILPDHEAEASTISKETLKAYINALGKLKKASDELKEVMQYIYNELI
ncbi:MAG: S8/S53 family peptidase [Spirochaetales bacterium]|nr:S8/S53 family peptidase [Spirochaetales bacterium]